VDVGGRLRLSDSFVLAATTYSFEAPFACGLSSNRLFDRAGYVNLAEISPTNPTGAGAYVTFYRHPAGSVVIEQVPGPEERPDPMKFSAGTLATPHNSLRQIEGPCQ